MVLMMNMDRVLNYLGQYGIYFLFVVIFLEYLNFPGFPAGVIMPAAGIVVSRGEIPFWQAIAASFLAGLLGSVILYGLGFMIGKRLLAWMYGRFKSTRKPLDKVQGYMDKFGGKGMFLTRLIPVIRTIIPLVEGASRRDFLNFLIYSSLGIFIWNLATISLGFFFEQWFLS